MPYFYGIQGSTVPYFMLKLWNILRNPHSLKVRVRTSQYLYCFKKYTGVEMKARFS